MKDLSPIEVVQMSADEYASKELQQWRKAEAAKDIEAIKTHELDMLALGNTFVMKSHKGEQVIEKTDPVSSSTSDQKTILPEDQEPVAEMRDASSVHTLGEQTTNTKLSGEKKHKSDRHRERHSSSRSKDKKHSRDKDKRSSDKKHSSSSSSDKKHSSSSSSDKKHSSSSSSDKKHSSSSKSSGSSSSKSKHSSSKHSSSSSKKKERSKSQEQSSPSKKVETPVKEDATVNSSTTSEMDDLQERLNKATAAIEAAKKSVATLGQETVTAEAFIDDSVPEGPGSPIDIDLPVADDEGLMAGAVPGEVTSTVTIPTPEQASWSTMSDTDPSVWEGTVLMQDVAKFSVSAFQVSGTSDYLRYCFEKYLDFILMQ